MANKKTKAAERDYPLLATKLYVPKPRPELVERTHLIERLNTGIHRALTLVSAPAGFGKTTFLSAWVLQSRLPVAWISLDNSDNDPVYFFEYVIAALQTVEPEVGKTAQILLHAPQPPSFETILIDLLRDVEGIPKEFVLVFDDYHVIDTEQIHRFIELLLSHLPPRMHLVLATRVDPPLPLARMRVRNQLAEFRASDLSFTSDETTRFFNTVMHLNLSDQDIARLGSRTEGWIAGLQLAGLSMQGRADVSSFIQAFAGDDRLVVDYLTEEVLSRQPEHIQKFLLQTSILDRLSEPLCDYVTDQQGSQKLLEALERDNLFLVPLDNRRQWYRYHHLFADLLRQRLQQQERGTVNRLHIKASEWFDTNGFKEEAVEHALAVNEFERAAQLIEVYRAAKWHGGEQLTLFKWLDQLPDEYKIGKPNLGLCHARVLFQSGRQEDAEEIIDQLERIHINVSTESRRVSNGKRKMPVDSATTDLQGRIAAIKAYMATRKGDIASIVKYSQQALDYLSTEDYIWRAIVANSKAIAHDLKGEGTAAIEAHFEAMEAAMKAGNVYLYMIERLWLAIGLKHAGQLPRAMNICKQLFGELNDKKLAFNVAVGHINGTWGEMLYELNELDEAHRYAKKGVEHLEQGHDVSHLAYRYSCLAKILCSRGDLAGAEGVVPKMDELMRTSTIPPWVLTQIKAVKARILLLKGNIDSLAKWVTECGLKLSDEPTLQFDAERIMFARILIAQNRFDDALELLNRLIAENEKSGRVLNQIETLVLQAIAFKKSQKGIESIAAIEKALSLAAPGGYVRVFVDEGRPIAELLEKILGAKGDIPRAFVKKLLPAFKLRKLMNTDDGLVEQLSDRELEVLRLVAAGLSNNKIVEELFISLSTVKTHLRNIYGKLDVHSRTEAIVKARKFSLI